MSRKMENSREPSQQWKNKAEFLMVILGNSIGIGNLWRFPYLCFNNGGGAFLVPFVIMAIIVAFPIMTADFAIAQYGQRGSQACWEAVPLMSGVGWAINIGTFLVAPMLTCIVAFGAFYMFSSLRKTLPWANCDNVWNTPRCRTFEDILTMWEKYGQLNGTGLYLNNSSNELLLFPKNSTELPPRSPSDEFFHFELFDITSGIEDLGTVRWPLCLSLLFTLAVAFGILSYGIKSWGKLSFFTTLLPYVVMFALLGYSLTINGAREGILYFLWPKWDKLASYSVWTDAAIQVLLSIGGAAGNCLHIGSHNKFNNNFIRDGVVLVVCDILTSVLCGSVIFSILGTMMFKLDVSIADVAGKGAGMPIIVYADMLTHMPAAPVWSVVFNFMLFCLGMGPTVCAISMVQKCIQETLPNKFRSWNMSRLILAVLVMNWFLVGLIYTTQGGMYAIQLVDGNILAFILLLCIGKVIAFGWIYGNKRLSREIHAMTGRKLHFIFWIIYKFVTPAILFVCLVLKLTSVKPLSYGTYVFPGWSQALSWILVGLLTIIIPCVAFYKLSFTMRNISLKERWVVLTTPTSDWGPSSKDKIAMKKMASPEAERLNLPVDI